MLIKEHQGENFLANKIPQYLYQEYLTVLLVLETLEGQRNSKLKLSEVPRRGLIYRGIGNEKTVQSVKEHSENMQFLLWLFLTSEQFQIDKDKANMPIILIKALTVAAIHDILEIYTGDIIPADNISDELKRKVEKSALTKFMTDVSKIMGAKTANLLRKILESYEDKKHDYERHVKAVDIIEMWLTVSLYANVPENVQKLKSYAEEQFSLAKVKQMGNQKLYRIGLEIFNELRVKCGLPPITILS